MAIRKLGGKSNTKNNKTKMICIINKSKINPFTNNTSHGSVRGNFGPYKENIDNILNILSRDRESELYEIFIDPKTNKEIGRVKLDVVNYDKNNYEIYKAEKEAEMMSKKKNDYKMQKEDDPSPYEKRKMEVNKNLKNNYTNKNKKENKQTNVTSNLAENTKPTTNDLSLDNNMEEI